VQRAIVAPAPPPGLRLCALDTSTFVASLALLQGERIVGELALPTRASHSESLLEALDGLLASCGWTLESIDAFAVGTGPGSFTGVRIGMATLRALAWTLERPLVGCPTLDLLAMNAVGRTGAVAAVLDARKKEVYFAVYRLTTAGDTDAHTQRAPLVPLLPPAVLPPVAALARIGAVAREAREPLWIVGDGPLRYPCGVSTRDALPGLRVGRPSTRSRARRLALGARWRSRPNWACARTVRHGARDRGRRRSTCAPPRPSSRPAGRTVTRGACGHRLLGGDR
jgi:tRNA threonylcarbamoyl adenosine modification protein YeaZ